MNIFDDKKFEEIQFAKSWFQINGSKFYQFLACLMPLNVTGSVSIHSMERKEV